MKFLIVLCAVVVSSYGMIYCPPNICDTVKCAAVNENECDGRIEAKGGWCGCCPTCIKQLDENENCLKTILLGAPKSVECKPNLYCHIESRLCKKKTCAMVKAEKEALLQQKPPLLGLTVPTCVDDGTYHPKQCIEAECFCVNAEGERIESYRSPAWEADDMNCQCARDKHDYSKLGIVGKMHFCDDKGNYEKIQCTGSVCYCVNELGAAISPGSQGVHISQMSTLKC